MAVAGIKYTKDDLGRNRYLRIDLDKFRRNELFEDVLDGLEALAGKTEETIALDEFNQYIDNRLKSNV